MNSGNLKKNDRSITWNQTIENFKDQVEMFKNRSDMIEF